MQKKIFSLLFAASIITMSASSQTIKDNIDKLAKDKNTKERSAKADVLIQKNTISDSTQIKTQEKVISKTPTVKQKYKRAKYKKKTKKDTK